MSSRPSRTGRATPPRAPRRRRAGAPPLPELSCPLPLPGVCSHHGLKKDAEPPPPVPSPPAPWCSTMSSWMRRRHQFFPLRRRGWGPCSAVPLARDRAEEAASQGRRPRTLGAAASAESASSRGGGIRELQWKATRQGGRRAPRTSAGSKGGVGREKEREREGGGEGRIYQFWRVFLYIFMPRGVMSRGMDLSDTT